MTDPPPPPLSRLLEATGPARDDAWTGFLDAYSERILHTARSLKGDDDAVMDRYVYVLEELQRDDYRRLREYEVDPRATFTTWLSLVARRLCLDHHRKKYGRAPASDANPGPEARARRRLVDLVGSKIDLERLAAPPAERPDRRVERNERREALESVLDARSPRDRLLLTLRFQDGLTAKEIGRLLDFPSQFHVYRRLKKVLGELRGELEDRGITK